MQSKISMKQKSEHQNSDGLGVAMSVCHMVRAPRTEWKSERYIIESGGNGRAHHVKVIPDGLQSDLFIRMIQSRCSKIELVQTSFSESFDHDYKRNLSTHPHPPNSEYVKRSRL